VDEDDDRFPDFFVGFKKAVVDAELSSAVADDNRAIRRKSHSILRPKPKPLQS
jgi:hypothetical protein